jgi:hypothetical protein
MCQVVKKNEFLNNTPISIGYAMAQFVEALRYKPEVAGSIPDGVTGIFQWLNPSCRIVAMGSTQPLTETNTRNPSWG